MIKENQKLLNNIQMMIDGIIILGSYFLAWYLRFKSGIFRLDEGFLGIDEYMKQLIYIIPVYLLLYYFFHLYEPRRVMGRRLEVWRIFQANLIGLMAVILWLYVSEQQHISRRMLFIFFCSNVFFETLQRNIIRMILRRMRRVGYNQKHMILVGYSRAAEQYIDRILGNPEWGYTVRGILDDTLPRGSEYRGIKVIGGVMDLEVILPANKLDEIAITLGLDEYNKLGKVVSMCEKSGVHTQFIPDYNHIIPTKPYTEDIQGLPVINIRHVPLMNTVNRFIKRLVDIFGALFAIVIFSPVMLLVSIIIKLTSPGPLIYKQERIGYKNKPFYIYKFRSMVVQKEEDEAKRWTVKGDIRVTPIGRFIRKTSIDEFPQFFNVLRGNMSLVGPRPERPQFVKQFQEEIPRYMVKHQVRPGITGWAQINGYRGDTSIKKRIECDLYYIENWSLGLDIKIIILTFFKGFINKNAY